MSEQGERSSGAERATIDVRTLMIVVGVAAALLVRPPSGLRAEARRAGRTQTRPRLDLTRRPTTPRRSS